MERMYRPDAAQRGRDDHSGGEGENHQPDAHRPVDGRAEQLAGAGEAGADAAGAPLLAPHQDRADHPEDGDAVLDGADVDPRRRVAAGDLVEVLACEGGDHADGHPTHQRGQEVLETAGQSGRQRLDDEEGEDVAVEPGRRRQDDAGERGDGAADAPRQRADAVHPDPAERCRLAAVGDRADGGADAGALVEHPQRHAEQQRQHGDPEHVVGEHQDADAVVARPEDRRARCASRRRRGAGRG